MKKVLFGCVAASVLLTGIAVISLSKKSNEQPVKSVSVPVNIVLPHSDGNLLTKDANNNIVVIEPSNSKYYTVSEEQILAAIEDYLYSMGIDKTVRPDIKAEGDNFIITIDNPSDMTQPPHTLQMIRIADFNGMKQYKITTTSPVMWKTISHQILPTGQVDIASYEETISWVPDLSLTTNSSLKANKISITDKDFVITADSIITDSLVGPQKNKMDVAGTTDILNTKITMPFFEISIPKITQTMTLTGANQIGDKSIQPLTADKSSSTFLIPQLIVSSPLLGEKPLTAEIKSEMTYDNQLNLVFYISKIEAPTAAFEIKPKSIASDIIIEGLDKQQLIEYTQIQKEYEEIEPNTPKAVELENKIVDMQNAILNNVTANIKNISVILQNGNIVLTGTVKYAEPAVNADLKLAITNFDAISPAAQPIDKEACEKALATINPQTSPSQLPPVCQQKTGVLEILRPFLETAEHSVNNQGEPVDTFTINYSADRISINGQEILPPANISIDEVQASETIVQQ
ncbi:MAG: hypothetical protein IKY98_03925 [Alphaproteobacteria bacterium]|nr:hypothetical protein [Alphaproteobacteria bacterium]